jgi:hypothetical protein
MQTVTLGFLECGYIKNIYIHGVNDVKKLVLELSKKSMPEMINLFTGHTDHYLPSLLPSKYTGKSMPVPENLYFTEIISEATDIHIELFLVYVAEPTTRFNSKGLWICNFNNRMENGYITPKEGVFTRIKSEKKKPKVWKNKMRSLPL